MQQPHVCGLAVLIGIWLKTINATRSQHIRQQLNIAPIVNYFTANSGIHCNLFIALMLGAKQKVHY